MQKKLKQALTMLSALGMLTAVAPLTTAQAATTKFSRLSSSQKLKSFKWRFNAKNSGGSSAEFDIKITNHTKRAFTFTPKNIHVHERSGKTTYHYPVSSLHKTVRVKAHHSVTVKGAFVMGEIEFTGAENPSTTTYLTYGKKSRISSKFTTKHAQKTLTKTSWH